MNKATLITIVGVVIAIVVAWWLVNAIFGLIAFVVKLLVVLAVAALVFVAFRAAFAGGRGD
jgi:uncharacterized membrane protein YwzB